ncbi:hypothetical protein BOX15_Mlig009583g3, partial [Macrostomum lignano]
LLLRLAAAAALILSLLAEEVAFRIEEETDLKATVGNVWTGLGRQPPAPEFRIIPASRFFSIDRDGHVRIESRIDREDPATCPDASETGSDCVIEFNAFNGTTRIVVKVTILDINDNSPTFKSPVKEIFIEEGDQRFSHPLDLATDADIGDNGMMTRGHYFLKEDEGTFALYRSQRDLLSLGLKGSPIIDYEQEQQYNLTLTACDGGREQRCSSQLLLVRVRDRNDNQPNVTSIWNPDVNESTPIGGLVARIYAHDRDSGENGRLSFTVTDSRTAAAFAIDPEGRVTLRKRLNARTKSEYDIPVLVSDGGVPQRQVTIKFRLRVIDVNDHEPKITVTPMPGGGGAGDSTVRIAENSRIDQTLAFIQVTDGDLGENARVTCSLAPGNRGGANFRLKESSNSDYFLQNSRQFDFESTPELVAEIRCHDGGRPPLKASEVVRVQVVGRNEFQPSIQLSEKGSYKTIEETHPGGGVQIGDPLLTVTAQDKDRGDRLTFGLDGSHSRFFVISDNTTSYSEELGATTATAVIRVAATIDRDTLNAPGDLLHFTVTVADTEDSAGSRHSASTTVTVSVIDANDNAPRIQPPLLFQLKESEKAGALATSVHPRGAAKIAFDDADQGINARVAFRLLALSGRNGTGQRVAFPLPGRPSRWPLNVTEDGQIRATESLDREEFYEYQLTVAIVNHVASPQLSSVAELIVQVLDVNDNSPEFVFPPRRGASISISAGHRLGDEVTRIEARDRDEFSNITYTLVGGSGSAFFELDRFSGQVRLVHELSPGQHELVIRADDNVEYSRSVQTSLFINVTHYGGLGIGQLKDVHVNLSIIVGMIIVTGVVSVGLVSAIVCVRRRSQSRGSGSGSSGGGGHHGGCGGSLSSSPECDKDHCQCRASLPDPDAADPLYGGHHHQHHLGASPGTGKRPERQFPLTTFSHNGSAFDLQPMPVMEHQQQPQHLQHPQPHVPRNEVMVNPQDLDGESADSGRGGSEDGHGGHHLLMGGSRCATLPPQLLHHHHQQQHQPQPPFQPHHHHQQRVMSPPPHMKSPCQCLGIPEDEEESASNSSPAAALLTGAGATGSFLPPPVPPHGVEYGGSGGGTLGRRQPQHHHQFQPPQHHGFYQQLHHQSPGTAGRAGLNGGGERLC